MPQYNLGKNLLNNHRAANVIERRKAVERDLINAESALGRTLFGAVPAGRNREFFCYKQNVWFWVEDGTVIRYEVRQNGVFKKVDMGGYTKVTGEELENFRAAVRAYLKLVKSHLYR